METCLVRVAMVTMFGTPALGTDTVAQARDCARVSVTWKKLLVYLFWQGVNA